MKRQATAWGKIFVNNVFDKGLIYLKCIKNCQAQQEKNTLIRK